MIEKFFAKVAKNHNIKRGKTTYIQVLIKLSGKFHCASTVIKSILPRVQEERNSELPSSVHSQGVSNGNEVFQALRHFAASNCQVARVQEVANPAIVVVVSLWTFNCNEKHCKAGSF